MKIIISILFLFFLSTSSFANTYAILKGDIQSLSFENHNKLTKSIINVMEHFADEKQLNEIEQMLSKNDNLNINPRNLNEFICLHFVCNDKIGSSIPPYGTIFYFIFLVYL